MKFCLLLSALTVVTARTILGGRQRITYTFEDAGVYMKEAGIAAEIVDQDTHTDKWQCDLALPPTCYPPPLTKEAIDEIKDLKGLEVTYLKSRRKDM